MEELPLVSIIIPTFNNSSVVCQAIDCSLKQTYGNVEVIVVDDGSTDDTERLLNEKYKDKIIYVRQTNKGTGGARNTGIRYASGKYLQFLDADDLLDLDKIHLQVGQLQNVPGNSLSYCDYVYCDIDDMTVIYKRHRVILQQENPLVDIIQNWETELSIPVHCFLFSASFFKEHTLSFDERLKANEDWDLLLNIFALDPVVVFIDRVLASYRMRRNSRCRNRIKMRQSNLTVINKQIQKNLGNNEILNSLKIRKKQIKFLYRDVGLLMTILGRCHPIISKIYCKVIPWRIQRIFD